MGTKLLIPRAGPKVPSEYTRNRPGMGSKWGKRSPTEGLQQFLDRNAFGDGQRLALVVADFQGGIDPQALVEGGKQVADRSHGIALDAGAVLFGRAKHLTALDR